MLHAGRHDLTTPVAPISVAAFTHPADPCAARDCLEGASRFHYLRRGASSTPSAARDATWNAASMPRTSVPPSGASSRIASPAWLGAAVTPARHPHLSAAASISAMSASRSGGPITRTEQAALMPPSASQFPDRSLPQMLPRSTTTRAPSGRMMRVSAANRANLPPRRFGSCTANPSAMIRIADSDLFRPGIPT